VQPCHRDRCARRLAPLGVTDAQYPPSPSASARHPGARLLSTGRDATAVVRQGLRRAPGKCDLQSQSQRVHHRQDRDGRHRRGLASAPGPQAARVGLSGVAKVPRAECAVDLPCVAGRLAIAVYRTFNASLKLALWPSPKPGPPRAEASRHLCQTAWERSPL